MNIYYWKDLDEKGKRKILDRAEIDISQQKKIAQKIIDDVKERKDEAVLYYTEKFDGVRLSQDSMKVTEKEIEEGYKRISPKFRETLNFAAENIRKFHEKQMPESIWFTENMPGVIVGEKVTPISDICLYVPRGKGSFPSVLLMLAIPALVAGVSRIVIVTPPDLKGNLDDSVLAAAKVVGVKEIYKVGGVQAVAAVAFGTETIPACKKILGPGNSYVTAAKRLLNGILDVGLPAGPSEGLILADESADPLKVALDLMIEAEHGSDSASLLVTHVESLAEKVVKIIEKKLLRLSELRKTYITNVFNGYGGIVLTESLEQSIDFVNNYAPEHLEVLTENPFEILPKIINAGEILLGKNTPITFANFLLGPNAILPTGGSAKTHSSVSVYDYLKRSSVAYVTKEGYKGLKDKAICFAKEEGFESHALAVEGREEGDNNEN